MKPITALLVVVLVLLVVCLFLAYQVRASCDGHNFSEWHTPLMSETEYWLGDVEERRTTGWRTYYKIPLIEKQRRKCKNEGCNTTEWRRETVLWFTFKNRLPDVLNDNG